jgi:CheY-like chemotaxis protein
MDEDESISKLETSRANRLESIILEHKEMELQTIRHIEPQKTLKTKIVAMSANSDSETRQEALAVGADDFVGKPFNISTFEELYQRITQKA